MSSAERCWSGSAQQVGDELAQVRAALPFLDRIALRTARHLEDSSGNRAQAAWR